MLVVVGVIQVKKNKWVLLLYWTVYISKRGWEQNKITNVKADRRGGDEGNRAQTWYDTITPGVPASDHLLFPCKAFRMTPRGGDSWLLSPHSFSVRGQLVRLGLSPRQRRRRRCACVSALSRVIAVCQRVRPSFTRGVCRLVRVA